MSVLRATASSSASSRPGLVVLPQRLRVAAVAADEAAAADCDAVLTTLDALGVAFERVAAPSGRCPDGARAALLVDGPRLPLPLEATVFGLRGVLPGLLPTIDCRLLGLDARAVPDADALRALLAGVEGEILVAVRSVPGASLVADLAGPHRSVRVLEPERVPERLLLEDGPLPRALVTTMEEQGVLTAMLRALSGNAGVAAELRTLSSPDLGFAAVDCSSACGRHPHGLLRALVALLRRCGRVAAADRLLDAWLLALEQGLTTSGLATLAPYGRVLDADTFVAAVIDRLECRPRRRPLCEGHASAGAGDERPALSVVDGGAG